MSAAIAERDSVIASLRALIVSLESKIATLESALVSHANEVSILNRRLYGTKSERRGTSELQLTLGGLLAEQAKLQEALDALVKGSGAPAPTGEVAAAVASETPPAPPASAPPAKVRPTPKGRRDLSASNLPKVLVEIRDEALAKTSRVIGFETSRQLYRQRGCFKVIVKRVAKYEIELGEKTTVLSAPQPRTVLRGSMLHESVVAWLAHQKFAMGVPHYRLEQHLLSQAERLDRATMGRNIEVAGNTFGATIVHAMMRDAIENCGVLSTDATGASVQPGPRKGGPKRACKKGHFFTIVADRTHVLFAFVERHTQEAVAKLFEGFRGYLQSDASSVYDILERPPPGQHESSVVLVGCWAHLRRYFFEAAICKYPIGVEGLARIGAIFAADAALGEMPPERRRRERQAVVAPLIDDFFAWVKVVARDSGARNLATRALGYAENQEQELRRVLLDGRLALDNTRSERSLRTIVVGRKNWLFYGSDVHAEAAAAFFTLIASCRLHGIDAELYLEETLRLLAYWPRDRYLELAPVNWVATRARLDPDELDVPIGEITVPPRVG